MSRLSPSFVLGYHGCDKVVADKILAGKAHVRHSSNDHDWLGSGSYFWEGDSRRALDWAKGLKTRNKISAPAVVGAIIDLRNTLNLSSQEGITFLKAAFESYKALRDKDGEALPENFSPAGTASQDKLIRKLDNAVIMHLHGIIANQNDIEPFDTVRGMFIEGDEVYPSAGFRVKSHVQIAVRTNECILGYFRPLDL